MGELESVGRPHGVRDRGVPSNLDLTRVSRGGGNLFRWIPTSSCCNFNLPLIIHIDPHSTCFSRVETPLQVVELFEDIAGVARRGQRTFDALCHPERGAPKGQSRSRGRKGGRGDIFRL